MLKVLVIYLMLSTGYVCAQERIDSLVHYGFTDNVSSVTFEHFKITESSDTQAYFVPSVPKYYLFYTTGVLKEKAWAEYDGRIVKKVVVRTPNSSKLDITHFNMESVPKMEDAFYFEFDESRRIIRTKELRGPGYLEETKYKYGNQGLIERRVFDNGQLLSLFKYDYVPSQRKWHTKTEYNISNAMVDSKTQVFDGDGRLIRFKSIDAEEGPIEDRSVTYVGDDLKTTVIRLNEGFDNGLAFIDSTIEKFVDNQPIEKLKFDSSKRLEKRTIWSYTNGKLFAKERFNNKGALTKKTMYKYPSAGKTEKNEYDGNSIIRMHRETDINAKGLVVYTCEERGPNQITTHFKYESQGNLIESVKREIRPKEDIDITILERRKIEYFTTK